MTLCLEAAIGLWKPTEDHAAELAAKAKVVIKKPLGVK